MVKLQKTKKPQSQISSIATMGPYPTKSAFYRVENNCPEFFECEIGLQLEWSFSLLFFCP